MHLKDSGYPTQTWLVALDSPNKDEVIHENIYKLKLPKKLIEKDLHGK